MTFHHAALATLMLLAQPAPEQAVHPLANFERLDAGEWRVTFAGGTTQFNRWDWGPGRHSMQAQTFGHGAAGEPWRALRVFYWHPRRQQVDLLGLSPFARGVSEGTITFTDDTATASFDLFQTGVERTMALSWNFIDGDTYQETLLESINTGAPVPLATWTHTRSRTLSALPDNAIQDPPQLSEPLRPFAPFIDHTWVTTLDPDVENAARLETTFAWIPYANGIHARTDSIDADDRRTHLLDTYIYHHTGLQRTRCLALAAWGGVYECDVRINEDGSFELDGIGADHATLLTFETRLTSSDDGTMRQQIWRKDDPTPRDAPWFDLRHVQLTSTSDD